jgi:hypothetical protein
MVFRQFGVIRCRAWEQINSVGLCHILSSRDVDKRLPIGSNSAPVLQSQGLRTRYVQTSERLHADGQERVGVSSPNPAYSSGVRHIGCLARANMLLWSARPFVPVRLLV